MFQSIVVILFILMISLRDYIAKYVSKTFKEGLTLKIFTILLVIFFSMSTLILSSSPAITNSFIQVILPFVKKVKVETIADSQLLYFLVTFVLLIKLIKLTLIKLYDLRENYALVYTNYDLNEKSYEDYSKENTYLINLELLN